MVPFEMTRIKFAQIVEQQVIVNTNVPKLRILQSILPVAFAVVMVIPLVIVWNVTIPKLYNKPSNVIKNWIANILV
jgi:uncharacterized membrane protein YkvI